MKKLLLVIIASICCSPTFAYQVTYLLYGTLDQAVYSASPAENLNSPFFGMLSFDSDATLYSQPHHFTDDEADNTKFYASIASINYTFSFGGNIYSDTKNGCCGLWSYTDSGISYFDEGPINSGGPFYRQRFNLNFKTDGTEQSGADFLLTENFTGGTFSFADGIPCWSDSSLACSETGTITTIARVPSSNVPEPSSIALFAAGLTGLILRKKFKI